MWRLTVGTGEWGGRVPTLNIKKMWKMLNFKVQQVAVDLVVDIRIILLLAQVQPWDIHRRLEAKRVQAVTV